MFVRGVQILQRGSKYYRKIWTGGPITTGVQILRDRTIHQANQLTQDHFLGSCSDGDIRLVDQLSPTSGKVEVCFGGIWGTVCDNIYSVRDDTELWDDRDAAVACRQLEFDDRGTQEKKQHITYVLN